jgi:hypothetical protein
MHDVVTFPSLVNPDLGCAAQPSDPIKAGQQAWERLQAHQTWDDWKAVGFALAEGRTRAMAAAKTNQPRGSCYNKIYSGWLGARGFDGLGKSTRARLLQCMENIDAIDAWLQTLKADRRLKLNHPTTVLSAWKRSTAAPKAKTKKPVPDWVAAWQKTPDGEKTRGLERLRLQDFLTVIPVAWRTELLRRRNNLDSGTPDSKITTILQTALSNIAAAISPATSEIVAKSQEQAALNALRRLHRALGGLGRDLHDVKIVLTSAKSSKRKRAF